MYFGKEEKNKIYNIIYFIDVSRRNLNKKSFGLHVEVFIILYDLRL